jgi:alanyl-tRNA synthetase
MNNLRSELIYYQDAYIREIDAEVLDVIPLKSKFGIVLDRTLFYAESGGQPGDQGWLNEIPVEDVQKKDDKILHITSQNIPRGIKVHLKLDWARRFEYMQIHTAQHIISATFMDLLELDTGSIHFGTESLFLDVKVKNLNADDIQKIEDRSNAIVMENHPLHFHWFSNPQDLTHLPLRSPPPTIDTTKGERIRIVEVENLDYTPCGGVHVRSTGELGIIKIIKWTAMKDMTRVEFVCGIRALNLIQYWQKTLQDVNELFPGRGKDLVEALQKHIENSKQMKDVNLKLWDQVLEIDAIQLKKNAISIKAWHLITHIFDDNDIHNNVDVMKRLANIIIQNEKTIIILVTKGVKVNVLIARSPDVSVNMDQLLKKTISKLNGKGGGKPEFAQGSGLADNSAIGEFLDEIKIQLNK